MHSFTFAEHELQVAQLARELGFSSVIASSQIMKRIKIVHRGSSACVDAFLSPSIHAYIQGFAAGFDQHFFDNVSVLFMQSDGGLASVDSFAAFKAILSGPAGGVVGYSKLTYVSFVCAYISLIFYL
eukprot:Partr_v1_DN28792_c2_g1_i1_m63408 putative 5-oxoprolinase